MTPKIVRVVPHADHTLTLTFENGDVRRFDMRPYLDSEVFGPLHNLDLFYQVRIVSGSLEWPGERDLAYDMLHFKSEPVHETAA